MSAINPTAGLQPIGIENDIITAAIDNEAKEIEKPQIRERLWGLAARIDPTVTFEEYRYWAKIEREEEHLANLAYKEEHGPRTVKSVLLGRFSKGIHHENKKKADAAAAAENDSGSVSPTDEKNPGVLSTHNSNAPTEAEWKQASRAMRTASWGTMFYLITTDILGWSSTPFVFASVGFGPGIALYLIFGAFAAFSGFILWKVFLGLDSTRFPMVSFGDTYFRVYGPLARHFINVAQAIQQFLTVAVLILGSGTTIAQLSSDKICFIVCLVIFTVVGMIFGSIRSLQRIGWLANLSVWLNIVSFLIIMVACANYPIDYSAYQQQAYGFAGQLNGINQLVYSYGGALLFIAFLAEMRHPWDFWKGMLCAQTFICVVYIFFGAFVYGHYGQYSASNINTVIQPFSLQTANNVLGLITGAIACLMYMNVGMKTVYVEVFQEILGLPPITTRKGRWLWYALGPLYWALAFVVGAAVPNLNGISGIVGALLILNFTYTFPALLYIGYRVKVDAALPGEGFDPVTGVTTRHDSGLQRWIRGYMVNWHLNTVNVIYFLGGLACSGLGSWAAIEGLIQVFGPGGTVATSFGCASPV
ncbi:transmembrane amino acid transporter [Trichoderma cornu-damae]|uniref:Transmembrane amino acid transporter n=1 Tax=Trichoderma cornu-damae TaxID=654480 RepID=A0A9P8QR93_9HYPO|nr:transmembrane amino acid transporter [Trichoderma cornu-damae]